MKKKEILSTIIVFCIIFICHFIVFLAFYPGICAYDLNVQITQYNEHAFYTNHPLLHTLFIGFFHNLFGNAKYNFNYNLGYACATIIQLFVIDGAMTYAVSYLHKRLKNHIPIYIAVVFYAVFPVNSLLAISHTKDILFAGFGLIFFIDSLTLLESQKNEKKYIRLIRMILNAVLMLLFRNNAVHAIIATSLLLILTILILKKKNHNVETITKYAKYMIAVTVLAITVNKSLVFATGAYPGSIKEMMSIPGQIMGRVYNTVATDEEKALIEEYIPNADEYNYCLADPMKKYLPFEIWESKCKHFLLDSTIIALKHPVISTQAVWYNIQGFIDPFHQPYSYNVFFLARRDYRGDAEQESKIPQLCDLYISLFYFNDPSKPYSLFLNMGLYIWLNIIACLIGLKHHRKEGFAYLFFLLYLCTLLLGPGAIIRYGYFFFLSVPVAIMQLFKKPASLTQK